MKKEPLPRIFFIGRNDTYQRMTTNVFSSYGLNIYKVLPPTEEFNLLDADTADAIIADVEDTSYPFKDCEILEIILELFPDKKIIAITNYYNPEILERIKQLGVKGYIFRNSVEEDLINNVKNILYGQSCYMVAKG